MANQSPAGVRPKRAVKRAPSPAGPSPAPESQLKLAAQVAEKLEAEIVRQGCPVGLSVGHETALAQRYGVSRWVMREALAITEQDGLTETRRGRNGGLVVATSADTAVAAALCNFLLFTRVDVRELIEVRKIVERVAYELAARRLDDSRLPAAIALLDRPPVGAYGDIANAIYVQTLRIANNNFVSVFASALSKLTGCLLALHEIHDPATGGGGETAERLVEIRHRQLECVVAADPHGAIEASGRAAEAWAEMFAQPASPRPPSAAARSARIQRIARRALLALHPGREPKLSSLVAMRIAIFILREQLKPGDAVAPEPELMALFGVGRHILRESIRVLERHGFVQIELGRNGGLRVGLPDPRAIVNRTVGYLTLLGVTRADIVPLTADMLILAAELAARRSQGPGRGVGEADPLASVARHLGELEASGARAGTTWLFSLGQALSAVTGNAILDIFFAILVEFHPQDQQYPVSREIDAASPQRLLGALRAADPRLARRAMAQLAAEFGMLQP